MPDFGLDHVLRLLGRGRLRVHRDRLEDVHVTPTAFVGDIPDDLLDERRTRLLAGQGTREWYLVTDEWPSEWLEDLRGDCGVLIVGVDDLEAARLALGGQ